jgi:hypothetical protein
MNGELTWLWKEAVVIYVKVLSLLGESKEIYE